MPAKPLSVYIAELAAGSSLGAGDKIPALESGALVYFGGDAVAGNQTIANSSDATSHTVTLSASGGSVQLVEGSGVTLTTTGSESAGVVTIAASGGASYLKYVALLTQSAPTTETSGSLIVGETYTITTFETGDDFENVADVQSGVINETGCVFIATGDTPTVWSNGSALDSEGNPRAVVLENTLGGTVVWSYNDVGDYSATLANAFTNNKTTIFVAAPSGVNQSFVVQFGFPDTFSFLTRSAGNAANAILFKTPIEVRVYQ